MLITFFSFLHFSIFLYLIFLLLFIFKYVCTFFNFLYYIEDLAYKKIYARRKCQSKNQEELRISTGDEYTVHKQSS
jgi:hypothetical protein